MKIPQTLKFLVRAAGNLHLPGPKPDIFLFATPRGGSTWLMEILASQPGMKFYDEPLNPRRDYAAPTGLTAWEQLMPDGDAEWITRFLQELQKGKHGLLNPTPFTRNHRFITNRIVFKIHEIEHLMGAVARSCNAKVIYLVRHPIATSISRHQLPRLPLFLKSQHYSELISDDAALNEIRAIAQRGTHFDKAIVSWCFENLEAVKFRNFDGLIVTYEELVLNPLRSCDLLLSYCDFTDRAAMLNAFERPAENIRMSNDKTLEVMQRKEAVARRYGLVTKWCNQVTAEQIKEAQKILSLFGIDAYSASDTLAAAPYLLFPDTRTIFDTQATPGGGRTSASAVAAA